MESEIASEQRSITERSLESEVEFCKRLSTKLRKRAIFSILQKCVFGKPVLKLDSLKTKGKYKGEENSFRKNFRRTDPQTREKIYP